MSIPNDRLYSEQHLWVKVEGQILTVGITDNAQSALSQIERIELPAVGTWLRGGTVCGSIESIKTVSDLFAPLDAVVVTRNEALDDDPGLVNDQPYETGWLMRLGDYPAAALGTLLDADAYQALIDA